MLTLWVGANTPWTYFQGDWFSNGILYNFFGNQYGWAPYYAYPTTYIIRPTTWYEPRWNSWYQGHPRYWTNFHRQYPYWRGHHAGQHYDQNFYNAHHRGQGAGWNRGFHGLHPSRPTGPGGQTPGTTGPAVRAPGGKPVGPPLGSRGPVSEGPGKAPPAPGGGSGLQRDTVGHRLADPGAHPGGFGIRSPQGGWEWPGQKGGQPSMAGQGGGVQAPKVQAQQARPPTPKGGGGGNRPRHQAEQEKSRRFIIFSEPCIRRRPMMKIYHLPLLLVILLAGCSGQTAGSFMGGMVGAVADGVVCGLTGADPETQNTFTNAFSEAGCVAWYAKRCRKAWGGLK